MQARMLFCHHNLWLGRAFNVSSLGALQHEPAPRALYSCPRNKTSEKLKTLVFVFRLELRWKRWASRTRPPQSTSSKIPSLRIGTLRSTPTRRSPPLWTQRALVRLGLVPERFFCRLKRRGGGKVCTLCQHRGDRSEGLVWLSSREGGVR